MTTPTTDDLLTKVNGLKDAARKYGEKLQQTKVKKGVLEDKLKQAREALSEAAGTIEFTQLDTVIALAATKAQEAIQKLTDALDDAGVEY